MKKLLLSFLILSSAIFQSIIAQVGINGSGNPPHSSAMLDVESTSSGFLLPRMTEVQRDAITDPAVGLQIYNTTTDCIQAYMPLGWRDVVCNCQSYPSSAFTNPGSGSANAAVAFAATSSGMTYSWSFQGGSPATSSSQNPSITWTSGGTFNISLTVADNNGCASTTNGSIVISVIPPSSPTLVCQAGYNITAGATPGYLGCVSFTYNGNSVTYTTVRAADNKEWLRQNLGSSQVATSGTDANSYGDWFQFGRWADGHQLRTPANVTNGIASPNNPSAFSGNPNGPNPFYAHNTTLWWASGAVTNTWTGTTAVDISTTNGIDPCKQLLGGGWRLPTSAEQVTMAGGEGITNGTTAYNSRLKLPMAGYRSPSDGSQSGVGTLGMYFSSTPSSSIPGYNTYLEFTTGGSGYTENYYRAGGGSVRCVK